MALSSHTDRKVCVPLVWSRLVCYGPITTKVSCVEVTHFAAQLWRNMNVWLGAKPVFLLNGLLLWLRLLFSSPSAGPLFHSLLRGEKKRRHKNKSVPHIELRLIDA